MTQDTKRSRWSSPNAKRRSQGGLGFSEDRRTAELERREKRNWKGRDIAEARPRRPLLTTPESVAAYWANHPATETLRPSGVSEAYAARIKALAHGDDDELPELTRRSCRACDAPVHYPHHKLCYRCGSPW